MLDQGELAVVKTSNAETPFTRCLAPLLTVDVWEHAYYWTIGTGVPTISLLLCRSI